MQRVAHPTCCGCGKMNPDYESLRFGIRVCYDCLYKTASWLSRIGALEHNPLCEELFGGVWEQTDSSYRVWHQSRHTDAAFVSADTWLRRIR